MYSSRNPLLIAGAHRRRFRVAGEFFTCPDGSQVKNDAAGRALCGPPPGQSIPTNTGGWGDTGGGTPPSGGGTGTGQGIPYVPPGSSGGGTGYGTPWTPPPSGGGGPGYGTPIPTVPTNTPGPCWPGNCAPPLQVCPENQKRYIMPFIPDAGFTSTVLAGNQVRFVGKPQKLFKPDRLVIASTIGPYFDIVNLIIGNIPQSLSQGNVAADMFSEVATDMLMSFDQAYPGIDVVIIAQNKSSVTQTFQAQLVGEAVG